MSSTEYVLLPELDVETVLTGRGGLFGKDVCAPTESAVYLFSVEFIASGPGFVVTDAEAKGGAMLDVDTLCG